ncbi:MAG: hypothetical protein IBX72_06250 [Nitrospirae bacterium]|jgi:hypothetical protein|nr:hypothetical protein [Nitrospirota bacterium]
MKFIVRRYFSGYCSCEIEAENEDEAYEKAVNLPIDQGEILSTLEEWTDSDEVELDLYGLNL